MTTIPGRIQTPAGREQYEQARQSATPAPSGEAVAFRQPVALGKRGGAGDLRSKMAALLSQHDALADDPEALDEQLRDYMSRTGVTSYSQAFAEFSAFTRELRGIVRMFEREDVDQGQVDRVAEAFARAEDHGATVSFRQALREGGSNV